MLDQDYTAKLLNLEFEKVAPAKEIGCRFNVSGATAMRYFRCVNFKPKELPEVVSLDEFKGNSGGQKYNSIVANPQNHKIIDVLPNRYENDLVRYFSKFESKKDAKYFVCDMNPHFRQVAKVCFKNAVIVADRYHVIRQVYWAMERVRKNEQNKLSVQFRKYFKKSRYLLMRPMEKLTEEEADQLALMFEIAPRLAAAYRLMLIFNYNVSFGRMEHFNMKIIMRRVSMIFYSENHRYDNAVRRCLLNRMKQFY